MTQPPEERPPLVVAMEWTTRVTTIALEMSLPILLGHWLDRWMGTWVLWLVLGAVFGLAAGMTHLIQLTRPAPRQTRDNEPPNDEVSKR